MTVKYSAFFPAAEVSGVLGTAIPATRNVNLGDWTAIADGTTLTAGTTVQYFGSTFVVVTGHIKGVATAAPDLNANYEIYASQGSDGATLYTWIAYADSADGATNFTTGAPGSRIYIGIASNKNSATESTNEIDYTWSKMQGPSGPSIVITPNKTGFVYVGGVLNPNPQTVNHTAVLDGISGTIYWSTVPDIKSGTGSTFSINDTEMGANAEVVVTATVGIYSQSVLLNKIADPTADKTSLNTAAAILGQAATATSTDFNVITGGTKPANNADVTANVLPAVNGSGIFAIAANYSGTITTALPFTRQFTAMQGITNVSSTTNWVLGGAFDILGLSVNNTPGSGTRGLVTVGLNQITANTTKSTGSGTATLTATLPSGAVVVINLVFTKTNAPYVEAGGSGATSASWNTLNNPASTTSAAISTEKIVRSDATGKIKISMDIGYSGTVGTSGSRTLSANVAYATTSGGALTDVFADTVPSRTADTWNSGDNAWNGFGRVLLALTQYTMPAANTDYYFKVKGKYSANGVNIDNAIVSIQQV